MASPQMILRHLLLFIAFVFWSSSITSATPISDHALAMREPAPFLEEPHWEWKRSPYFPDEPVSCKFCELHFDEIDSCANASTVFANVAQILFNPESFISVINCACTDTFKSTYPQCVNCFQQTNQSVFLEPEEGNLSSVVTGMRQICALASTLFGGVASVNSQLPGQTPVPAPSPNAAQRHVVGTVDIKEGAPVMVFLVFVASLATGSWTLL